MYIRCVIQHYNFLSAINIHATRICRVQQGSAARLTQENQPKGVACCPAWKNFDPILEHVVRRRIQHTKTGGENGNENRDIFSINRQQDGIC